jgi:membrane protease YdiL (CAAX protease family)
MLQVLPAPALPQYSARKALAVWAAAALPMGVLSWVFNPLLDGPIDAASGIEGTARLLLITIGLAWQPVLVILMLRREIPHLSWAALRERLWLGPPRSPSTGTSDPRIWLWLLVLMPLFAVSAFLVMPRINRAWVALVPLLAEPPAFSIGQLFSPASRASLEGAWWFYALFIVMALLNTVFGEEMVFRGLLLPRMHGAFGRWDWVANGVMFGAYHLHQPWGIPGSIANGVLLFALPARRFQCTWLAVAVHSTQSVYFGLLLLRVVLGRT